MANCVMANCVQRSCVWWTRYAGISSLRQMLAAAGHNLLLVLFSEGILRREWLELRLHYLNCDFVFNPSWRKLEVLCILTALSGCC